MVDSIKLQNNHIELIQAPVYSILGHKYILLYIKYCLIYDNIRAKMQMRDNFKFLERFNLSLKMHFPDAGNCSSEF